jgi:Glucosamine-6-phosphate isomerases/6-phosphogluconolactonase
VLRSPPSTFIPFLSKVSALKQRCPLMSARSNPSTARSAPRSSSIALRYDPSTVGAGWAYSLVVPRTAVLAERDRWVAAFVGAKSETRITLIYPALESSRHAAVLVVGKEKRAIFDRLRRGDDSLPAAPLHPNGAVCLFGDAAAGETVG